MKRTFFAIVAVLTTSGSAFGADCIISPDARGSTSGGALCRFGEDGEVQPEYAAQHEPRYLDYLFTPQEEFKMLKNLVRRAPNRGNNGALQGAIRGGTTPTRTLGPRRPVIAR